VVSFKPLPLYPRYPWDRRLGEPQSRSELCGEENILAPIGNRIPTRLSSSPYLVAIPTALQRLSGRTGKGNIRSDKIRKKRKIHVRGPYLLESVRLKKKNLKGGGEEVQIFLFLIMCPAVKTCGEVPDNSTDS
jgi:hypothetical protein